VATQAIWVASGASLRPRLAAGDFGGSRRALATCTYTDDGALAYSFAVRAASNASTFGTFERPSSDGNISNINFTLMAGQSA
jgi:hypothetical protein